MLTGTYRILLTAALLAGGGAEAASLGLDEAIAAALQRHPSLTVARESVNMSRARRTQAASAYFPQIKANTGYAESHSVTPLGDSVTRGYTTTLSANQLLYDFGRTGNTMDAARGAERTAEQEQQRAIQEVAMNVRQAYFEALKAIGLRSVAEKNLEQAKAHLAQAEAFYRSGSRPRFDVTRTEVEVNSAQLGLLNAVNGVRVSRLVLGNAMGSQLPDDLEIEDVPLALVDAPDLASAQRDALRNRPELLKAAAEVEAAEARLGSEQSQHLPNISAGGSYSWASGTAAMGVYRSDLDSSWNAGITLHMPLFEGGATRGRIAEARAGLKASEARREVLAQSVILEVNQAHADLENAEARLNVMESSLRKAKENLEIAQGRYQAGVGPYIEVTDARLSELNAEIDFVQARYDYQLSVARFGKAMGRTEPLPRRTADGTIR